MATPTTDAHRTAGAQAAQQVLGMPLGHAGDHLTQVIADADETGYRRGRDSILGAAVWCPDCGCDLESWVGHRTDPPCPYDTDTDTTEPTEAPA